METNRRNGLGSIFVTHNLPALAESVDRIYHMSSGRFVWQGTLSDLEEQKDDLPEETQEYMIYVKKIFQWQPTDRLLN